MVGLADRGHNTGLEGRWAQLPEKKSRPSEGAWDHLSCFGWTSIDRYSPDIASKEHTSSNPGNNGIENLENDEAFVARVILESGKMGDCRIGLNWLTV